MSDATTHVPKERILQAIRNEVLLTDEEMEHLLACTECMNLLGDFVSPDD